MNILARIGIPPDQGKPLLQRLALCGPWRWGMRRANGR